VEQVSIGVLGPSARMSAPPGGTPHEVAWVGWDAARPGEESHQAH
jgi:hypothetical protein